MLYKILVELPVEAAKDGSVKPETVIPLTDLDAKDGFIHLSTSEQLQATLGAFFSNVEEVTVLSVDLPDSRETEILAGNTGNRPGSKLQWDWVESRQQYFGHLYGDLENRDIIGSQVLHRVGDAWSHQDHVDFVYMGRSEQFVADLADVEDVESSDKVTIRFAAGPRQLSTFLYANMDYAKRPQGSLLLVWGFLSQLRANDGLTAENVVKELSVILGSLKQDDDFVLADTCDASSRIPMGLMVDESKYDTEQLVPLDRLLRRWLQVDES